MTPQTNRNTNSNANPIQKGVPMKPMFAIQWFDPYDGYHDSDGVYHAGKDGSPRGRFETEQDAIDKAEEQILMHGAFDTGYQIVKVCR